LKSIGITDVGRRREKNQDQFFTGTIHDHHLLLIADGMGGHKSGEIASAMAIEIVVNCAQEKLNSHPPIFTFMKEALFRANEAIYKKSLTDDSMQGMGTTFVSAIVYGSQAYISHIGDSRAYLYQNGSLEQLTNDHSLINELKKKNEYNQDEEKNIRHIVTRSLGTDEYVEADYELIDFKEGDLLLLCTDGLSDDVSLKKMENILRQDVQLEDKAQNLMNEALSAGGKDNITLCLMSY